MTTYIPAGIYARISKDDQGDTLAVTRQIKDGQALCDRLGWTVVGTYIDNDVSATRSKVRKDYQRAMADIRNGTLKALAVWDVDRLTRTNREIEDLIDLHEQLGVELASVGGEINLGTPQGKMMARIKGTVARHETDQMARRLRSKFDERAEAGLPHSPQAYGYRRVVVRDENDRRVSSRDEIDETQAAVLREAAQKVLTGQSVRSIVAELNEAGVPSAKGVRWSSNALHDVLIRPRNAGLRQHRGKVIGPAAWEPLWDEDTHDRLVAVLNDPNRVSSKGKRRRHLMSGIAVCGKCGSGSMNVVGSPTNPRHPYAYACRDCHGVSRKKDLVDDVVNEVMIGWLSDPDALRAAATGDEDEIERARAELDACDAKLKVAADAFADSDDDDALVVLNRIRAKLHPRVELANATIKANLPVNVPLDIAGSDARENWETAALDVKRALINLAYTVTIMPSRSGRHFDRALIKFDRKVRAGR